MFEPRRIGPRVGSALGSRTRFLRQFSVSGAPPPVTTVVITSGEMSEWLKEHAWKACVGETLPRVRIPLSPPALPQSADPPGRSARSIAPRTSVPTCLGGLALGSSHRTVPFPDDDMHRLVRGGSGVNILPLATGAAADHVGLKLALFVPALCYIWIAFYGIYAARHKVPRSP